MRTLAGMVIVLTGLVVPAAAQTPDEDLRSCDGGNLPREERIAACTRLIEAGDRSPAELTWIHDRRGNFYYAEEAFEAALADFVIVAELDPTNWEPHASIGRTLLQLRRDEEAVIAYDRAIELNPREAYSFYRRGLAKHFLDDFDQALRDYDRAIELNPNFVIALLGRGRLHLDEGRLDAALADFSIALELAPYDARTYAGRGKIYDEEGNIAEAIRDYRVAQLLNPNVMLPEERLPLFAPAEPAPDLGALTFVPPAEGLAVEYVQVVNEVQPEIDEMEAAIGDLIFWFIGEPDKPLPIDRSILRREIGPTEGNATTVAAVLRFAANREGAAVVYDHALLPLTAPAEDGPDAAFTYEGVEAIWQLAPGETTSGSGEMLIACPDEPDQMAALLGCLPGVPAIPIGTIEWTARFVGWEYVLVPAGYRGAARIVYDDITTTELFGRAVSRSATTTFWYDPEVRWWIKRERTDGEQIQTVEAWTISPP